MHYRTFMVLFGAVNHHPVSSRSSPLTIFSLPLRQKNYTPEIITAISQILSVNLSRFNVGTGHGQKREWEVGNKNLYDDLDTKMSGTRLSM